MIIRYKGKKKKVEYKGIIFDNQKECEFYKIFEVMKEIGMISEVFYQPKIEIHEIIYYDQKHKNVYFGNKKYSKNDKVLYPKLTYIADFVIYWDYLFLLNINDNLDRQKIVYDVKPWSKNKKQYLCDIIFKRKAKKLKILHNIDIQLLGRGLKSFKDPEIKLIDKTSKGSKTKKTKKNKKNS